MKSVDHPQNTLELSIHCSSALLEAALRTSLEPDDMADGD